MNKTLIKLLSVFVIVNNFLWLDKTPAIVPYFYIPNNKNLEKESLEIGKGAYQLLYFGQNKESLKLAKLAISINAKNEKLWAILAESQVANNLFDEALLSIKKAKEINPSMSELYFAEGSIYLKQKNIKKAKISLLKGLEIKPKNTNALFQLGNIFLIEKKYNNALKQYEKAINIEPRFWQAINNKGLVYFELNKIVKAINAFEKAIAIEENAEPILALAVSINSNKNEESIILAKKALQKNPKYVSSQYRKEQLWGEKLEKATAKLFLEKKLSVDIEIAKKYLD